MKQSNELTSRLDLLQALNTYILHISIVNLIFYTTSPSHTTLVSCVYMPKFLPHHTTVQPMQFQYQPFQNVFMHVFTFT